MGYRPRPPGPREQPDESARPPRVSTAPDRDTGQPEHGSLPRGHSGTGRSASLTVDPARQGYRLPDRASKEAPPHREGTTRLADAGIRGTDVPSAHDAVTEKGLITEAKDDWDNGAVPVLNEIRVHIDRVSQPTKDECVRLIVRIERNGAAVVSQDSNANQNLMLALTIDLLTLTETVDNAHAADDNEKEILAIIGAKVRGKLALSLWSVLARLGKLQQWTVNGELGVSLFGMVKGSGGLSITFGK
jgi:hypothetical protein